MSLLLSGSALFQIRFGNFSALLSKNNPLLRGKKKLYGKVERRARGFDRIFLKNFLFIQMRLNALLMRFLARIDFASYAIIEPKAFYIGMDIILMGSDICWKIDCGF